MYAYTIKRNEDGTAVVTNKIVVDADEFVFEGADPVKGFGIGWTQNAAGQWEAPVVEPTQEETSFFSPEDKNL